MESCETPRTDGYKKWGRSGTLYPSLIPDQKSVSYLRDLQSRLVKLNPGSRPVELLHSTLFYLKPRKLFQRLAEAIPELREEELYMELSCLVTALSLFNPNVDSPVDRLETFGPKNDGIGLEVTEPNHFNARLMLKRALGRQGVTEELWQDLAKEPRYHWTFGGSTQHISLVEGVSSSAHLAEIGFEVVGFSGFIEGSTKPPGDDPLRWHLGI